MDLKERWVHVSLQPSLGDPFVAIDRDYIPETPKPEEKSIPRAESPGIPPARTIDPIQIWVFERNQDTLLKQLEALQAQIRVLTESVREVRSMAEANSAKIAQVENLWFIRLWRWMKSKIDR